jgi:hypothetical protein
MKHNLALGLDVCGARGNLASLYMQIYVEIQLARFLLIHCTQLFQI